MDPYLERHWPDVHAKLVTYAADALNARLPGDLIARTEERIAIESGDDQSDQVSPDVRILDAQQRVEIPTQGGSTAALAPYRLVAMVEPLTEHFIEITEATGERLVTVIEFLSPANKRGRGLQEFISKRQKLLSGNVNFVEVDLVRAGDWQAMLRPQRPPTGVHSTYRATVRASSDPGAVHFQPIFLREPLPAIKIPLRPDDPPAELALQPLIEQAYMNGRYGRTLRYDQPVTPPLEADDAAWAAELMKGPA